VTRLVLLAVVVVVVASYLSWTASRLDRLTARVEAAWSALDAQLVRRAAAAGQLAAYERRHEGLNPHAAKVMEDAALRARIAGADDRQDLENDLTRAIRRALGAGRLRGERCDRLYEDLRDASTKVDLSRQFFNDAVRDNLDLRRRPAQRLMCRWRQDPERTFFEIADTTLRLIERSSDTRHMPSQRTPI
jgi:hypothetical protein